MSPPIRLFIASVGNPPPYQSTRHSAGHLMLHALREHLKLPMLKRSKVYASGPASDGAARGRPEYFLWQSPSLMNVSGTALVKAYRQFAAECGATAAAGHGAGPGGEFGEPPLPGLVLLHDEMELAPGALRARPGNLSARGHNGVRSVQQTLQSANLMVQLTAGPHASGGPGGRFVKIGVGIGRPAGGTREKEDVSNYVLSKFREDELAKVTGSVSTLVELLETARKNMSEGKF